MPQTKSYVRDTQHFISRLLEMGKIPDGALLVTLDVSSLYTNIPNHEGLIAVASHLRKDRTKDPITPYILELLKLVFFQNMARALIIFKWLSDQALN